jgi:CHAT domain-containing protein/tetratricopeptide (TPR) repeat protein
MSRLISCFRLSVLTLVLAVGPSAGRTAGAAVREYMPAVQSPQLEEADRLMQEAKEFYGQGKYEDAIRLIERSLAIREAALGAEHPDVASTLNNLAGLHLRRGDYARSESLFRRALSISEKAQGPEHPSVTSILDNLAQLYFERGDYLRAAPLRERALANREKRFGPAHPNVARALKDLGIVYLAQGEYARAEPLFRRSLEIYEKTLEPGHPVLAGPIYYLAETYRAKGDYMQAEPLHRRALSIRESGLGPEHTETAASLYGLALLYKARGDYARAEPLYQRALQIEEKAHGAEHPTLAIYLASFGALYEEKGDRARAEGLYQRALAIQEKSLGPEHPATATTLNNLANLYESQGDSARAEPLQQRALSIREKILGPEHPDVAQSLNNLAALSEAKGEYARAEPLFRRSLAIDEKALGPQHPSVAATLANLALLYGASGDPAQAVRLLARGNDIREYNLALILTTGSEEQKRLYLDTLLGETYATISLHVRTAPREESAARLALTTILRRKGRLLDAMSDRIGVLRQRLNPEDRALLEQLSAARSRLAALVLGGPSETPRAEQQRAVAALEAEVQRLEAAVSLRSDVFRAQSRPVTLEGVQQAIPQGVALVELVSYQPYDASLRRRDARFGAPRYVAYVVRRDGPPVWVELGEASAIDADVARLRAALVNPTTTDVKRLARALDERVMRPVRQLLGETRRVFLSPDGALNLVPFDALVDEAGRYLVETYTFTYLTSGRDLLRLQVRAESRGGPVVFANPSFGTVGPSAGPAVEGSRTADLSNVSFSPLPGTAGEAAALGTILKGVRVLTEAQATEAALKQVSGPSLLHVATHGFFLPDEPQTLVANTRGIGLSGGGGSATQAAAPRGGNPLLRSGLALAGINRRQSGASEDGVLTALEATGLDLWGTKLVVLSACETGIGDVKNGDGVYGLRRALVLAGAESQLMSLWQVSDEATRDLMIGYYRRLQAGEGRTEALRAVQLEMLGGGARQVQSAQERGLTMNEQRGGGAKAGDRSHPFFWASFIPVGDWRSLDGK